MIEAREFRLGNYVNYPHLIYSKNIPIAYNYDIIAGIENNSIRTNNSNGYFISDLLPIEIDEDWLEKFGFHYAPDCLIYGKSGWFKKLEYQDYPTYFFFNNHLQGSLFLSSDKIIVNHLNIDFECEYVHQFQNLYFSLTGQELTIK